MATQIYLGNPPPKIKEWIEKNYKPEVDMTKVPLCFAANEPGSSVGMSLIEWGYKPEDQVQLQYSADNMKTWNNWDMGTIQLDNCENKKMYLRANPEHPNIIGFGNVAEDWAYQFKMTGSIAASGNIQYLLTSDGNRNDVPNSCYYGLFYNCTSLTKAPLLPATTLDFECYQNMFYGCTALTQAPELPATTLASGCYTNMFQGCTSLTQAPALSAETLAYNCYSYMFKGCTALTNAYFPNLDSNTVINEVVESDQQTFSEAANNIETQCSDKTIVINSTSA